MEEIFTRLEAANIRILPVHVSPRHILFERGGYVALVEHSNGVLGEVGAAGVLTEKGSFATLVWRDDKPFFVGKGYERPADAEVSDLRAFQRDLGTALRG